MRRFGLVEKAIQRLEVRAIEDLTEREIQELLKYIYELEEEIEYHD